MSKIFDLSVNSTWRNIFIAGGLSILLAPFLLISLAYSLLQIPLAISDAAFYSMIAVVFIPGALLLGYVLFTYNERTKTSKNQTEYSKKVGFSGFLISIASYVIWDFSANYYGLMNKQDVAAYGLCVYLSAALLSGAVFFKDQL